MIFRPLLMLGSLMPPKAHNFMDQLAGLVRGLALTAIDEANADPSSDQSKISTAQDSLAEGDTLRAPGAFKDAVNKYNDALAQAEGALP